MNAKPSLTNAKLKKDVNPLSIKCSYYL